MKSQITFDELTPKQQKMLRAAVQRGEIRVNEMPPCHAGTGRSLRDKWLLTFRRPSGGNRWAAWIPTHLGVRITPEEWPLTFEGPDGTESDRRDAKKVVEWKEHRLTRRVVLSDVPARDGFRGFRGFWNYACLFAPVPPDPGESSVLAVELFADGGRARVRLMSDRGRADVFEGEGDDEKEALDQAWGRFRAVILRLADLVRP